MQWGGRTTKAKFLFMKNAGFYVFINIPHLWKMLGRLTLFIRTLLCDLTLHHFVNFLVYASIMSPCCCPPLFFLPSLALHSWAIFSAFRLPPDALTSPNLHNSERKYLQSSSSHPPFSYYWYVVLIKSYWLHIPLFQTTDNYSVWAHTVLYENRSQR